MPSAVSRMRLQVPQYGSLTGLMKPITPGRPGRRKLRALRPHLPWGTTVILITGSVDDALFDEIFRARRAGLNVVLILCGTVKNLAEIQHRAEHFGIPVQHFARERDLDIWRG